MRFNDEVYHMVEILTVYSAWELSDVFCSSSFWRIVSVSEGGIFCHNNCPITTLHAAVLAMKFLTLADQLKMPLKLRWYRQQKRALCFQHCFKTSWKTKLRVLLPSSNLLKSLFVRIQVVGKTRNIAIQLLQGKLYAFCCPFYRTLRKLTAEKYSDFENHYLLTLHLPNTNSSLLPALRRYVPPGDGLRIWKGWACSSSRLGV